ncbi:hypothetical protein VNO77_44090 [Canavalia gladiata]|uniref:Uncharacterized protein n=1 Tax=Canavalia gladiata TaxID=3824 RepID=A0AAN9PQF6_CANGL
MSRRLILQQAHGQSPRLGSSHCLGAYGFMFYFTPRWGFFSPFPHGTTSLSVTQEYLALQGCSTPLLCLAAQRLYSSPTTPFSRFRLLPFRSPLLRESVLLSFPLATKMFQFVSIEIKDLINIPDSTFDCIKKERRSVGLYMLPESEEGIQRSGEIAERVPTGDLKTPVVAGTRGHHSCPSFVLYPVQCGTAPLERSSIAGRMDPDCLKNKESGQELRSLCGAPEFAAPEINKSGLPMLLKLKE